MGRALRLAVRTAVIFAVRSRIPIDAEPAQVVHLLRDVHGLFASFLVGVFQPAE